jgi:hypothetical protein
MKDKTAKVLRQATSLLNRDLYPKEQARIPKQGCELVGAAKTTLGGRLAVSLTFSDGSSIHLSAQQTGGTVFRHGKPLAPKITPARAAPAKGNGRTAPRPRGAGRPRARTGSRSTSNGAGGDDPPEPPPSRLRLCAVCGGDLPADRKRDCTDRHADRDRQRRKRARDRERSGKVSTTNWRDDQRMLRFEPGERELLDNFYLYCRCDRCGGHHILAAPDDGPGPRCVKSGRLVRGAVG